MLCYVMRITSITQPAFGRRKDCTRCVLLPSGSNLCLPFRVLFLNKSVPALLADFVFRVFNGAAAFDARPDLRSA